jgi:hypothetical protein
MCVRSEIAHGEEHVERPLDVVALGLDGVPAVDHRVGSAGLFPVVDDRVRRDLAEDTVDERRIGEVADVASDVVARHLFPRTHPLVQRLDRRERIRAQLGCHRATKEVVDDRDVVTRVRHVHRGRPT